MWISKEELQKLVEKRARGLFVSSRIELITQETETLKKHIQRLEYEKNELEVKNNQLHKDLIANIDFSNSYIDELSKQKVKFIEENKVLKAELLDLKEENKDLLELYSASKKVQESLIPKCQKLHDENVELKEKNSLLIFQQQFLEIDNQRLGVITKRNEALESELVKFNRIHDLLNSIPNPFKEVESLTKENKQLKEENASLNRTLEKGLDCINISLLEQVAKLERGNILLEHQISGLKKQLAVLTSEREKQKIKAYHYDMYRHALAEECVFNKNANIGSQRCAQCPNNRGCDDINHWVKCALMPNGKPKKQ